MVQEPIRRMIYAGVGLLATALTFGACPMFPDNQCTLQASVLAVYLVGLIDKNGVSADTHFSLPNGIMV